MGVKAYSFNHWTAGKFKKLHILIASKGEHILNCLLTLFLFCAVPIEIPCLLLCFKILCMKLLYMLRISFVLLIF